MHKRAGCKVCTFYLYDKKEHRLERPLGHVVFVVEGDAEATNLR